MQKRKGDVTEAADEVVVGIEMVQAFGREEDVRGRFMERAQSVRDASIAAAHVDARFLPAAPVPAVARDRARALWSEDVR